jgi:hypothetical protein
MKTKMILTDKLEVLTEDFQFNYQPLLTIKLDNTKIDFNQEILNEIVLWKVSRYAHFDQATISELNDLNINGENISIDIKRSILKKLLNTHGVSLPMASTILRFKNKNVFQIIDQRVYRLIYGKPLKVYNNTPKNIEKSIDVYINYLDQLQEISNSKGIPFSESDRILYMMDKRVNRDVKIH